MKGINLLSTIRTLYQLFWDGMCFASVFFQFDLPLERCFAFCTGELQHLSCIIALLYYQTRGDMSILMTNQVGLLMECFRTLLAGIALVGTVNVPVTVQLVGSVVLQTLSTHRTTVDRFLLIARSIMCFVGGPRNEYFLTIAAVDRDGVRLFLLKFCSARLPAGHFLRHQLPLPHRLP